MTGVVFVQPGAVTLTALSFHPRNNCQGAVSGTLNFRSSVSVKEILMSFSLG